MKTISVLILLTMLSDFSKIAPVGAEISSHNALGERIVRCLQRQSAEEFAALLPSLDEFHLIMENNAAFYGENLEAAKKDFSNEYNESIAHKARLSFLNVLDEGVSRGIDWSNISFVRTEITSPLLSFSAPVTIVFTSRSKEYKLTVRPALIVENQWRISPNVNLQ